LHAVKVAFQRMITKEFNTDLAVENILGLLPRKLFEQVVGEDTDHG